MRFKKRSGICEWRTPRRCKNEATQERGQKQRPGHGARVRHTSERQPLCCTRGGNKVKEHRGRECNITGVFRRVAVAPWPGLCNVLAAFLLVSSFLPAASGRTPFACGLAAGLRAGGRTSHPCSGHRIHAAKTRASMPARFPAFWPQHIRAISRTDLCGRRLLPVGTVQSQQAASTSGPGRTPTENPRALY